MTQDELATTGFLPHQVGMVGVKVTYFTCTGKAKALFGTGMGFHLGHSLTI